MTSLSYGRIFCLEFQKIDGTYQRYNHYFKFFYFNFTLFFTLNLTTVYSKSKSKFEKRTMIRGKATLPL